MPLFWSKNGHFSMSFFQAIQARKMCFTIFQNKKTPFQPIKTTRSKSRKIEIFPKGLTHGFGQKMAIFSCVLFRQYRPRKCLLQYSSTKKPFIQPIKKEVQKVEKLRFFQKVMPWFWSKNGHFSMSFFQALQARKMCFTNFQNKKTPFQP